MLPRLAIAVILSLVVTFSSYAHDSDRIERLEREVQETKQRLSILESKLESKLQNTNDERDEKEPVITEDGWKSVANWRKLSSGMSALSVKNLLGDPHKIDGAKNAVWYYDNGGVVRIIDGNVDRWSEPE